MTTAAVGQRCPRCGETRPLGSFDVCAPCAAAEGWDPPCDACKTETRDEDVAGMRHVATCGGNRVKADAARVMEILDLSSKAQQALSAVTAAVREEALDRGAKQGARDALQRLHKQVCAALGANTDRERKARDEGREGDALLNAARADAFDWVLQRIDEELEAK